MLGLSAGIFYVPKLIWNLNEKGLMKDMCEEINAEGKAVEGHNMKRRTVDDGKTVKRLEQLLKQSKFLETIIFSANSIDGNV